MRSALFRTNHIFKIFASFTFLAILIVANFAMHHHRFYAHVRFFPFSVYFYGVNQNPLKQVNVLLVKIVLYENQCLSHVHPLSNLSSRLISYKINYLFRDLRNINYPYIYKICMLCTCQRKDRICQVLLSSTPSGGVGSD